MRRSANYSSRQDKTLQHDSRLMRASSTIVTPLLVNLHWLRAGVSTPYKRWSKCTMKKVGGKRFCRNLGGKCINY